IGLGEAHAVAGQSEQKKGLEKIGLESFIRRHIQDGSEYALTVGEVLNTGEALFKANWTEQDGGGRPLTKGTGRPLSDPKQPLTESRAFNRISAPDANSCAGCHNQPFGIAGGSGDFATSVSVLGQRFDFITFDPLDKIPTRGTVDESGKPATLQTIADS